jgi:hypothetical protein
VRTPVTLWAVPRLRDAALVRLVSRRLQAEIENRKSEIGSRPSFREWKLRLLIRLRRRQLSLRLAVANRERAAPSVQRRLPRAAPGHRDNIGIRVMRYGNISPSISLMVDIAPAPLATRRAHVERDRVRLGAPIVTLRDHILRTIREPNGCDNPAARRPNDEHDRAHGEEHQNTKNDGECPHDTLAAKLCNHRRKASDRGNISVHHSLA